MHRHNSLSALDVKLFKSKSVPTSPIHTCITRQQSTPSPTGIPEDETSNILHPSVIHPAVRFSLGGEVTTIPSISPAKMLNLSNENSTSTRNRYLDILKFYTYIFIILRIITKHICKKIILYDNNTIYAMNIFVYILNKKNIIILHYLFV